MKKKFLYIVLSIFVFFFNVNVVFSTETTNSEEELAEKCNYQQEKIDTYKDLKEQLIGIDCTDTSNETNVVTCNDSNIKKNLIVSELMKLDEKKLICSDKQDEVDAIIEENKDKCGKIFDDSFSEFVNGFMIFFYILGPILLIFFGSLDFAKATVSSDQEALRNAWKTFSKRLFATILLFATPTIVNILISFNVSDKYLSGNAYACDYKYLIYTKEYNIKYVPRKNNTGNGLKSDADYIWMAGKDYTNVTSVFGKRKRNPSANIENHNGIDIPITEGGNVYAIASGEIILAAGGCSKGYSGCNGGAGNYIVLQVNEPNGNVLQYTYMHNSSLNVKTGDIVNQGDIIAQAGSTGDSTGSHCHFRAYNVTKNLYVNPLTYTYGGLENISAIDEKTRQIVKVNVNATMYPGTWSYNAGTEWNTYKNCKEKNCSGGYNLN